MSESVKPYYEFGAFRLDPDERSLRRDGVPVQLTPKMFDILLFLVEHAEQLVSKNELIQAVWHDTFVEEANLTVNISSIRKALGESGSGHQYIETVQRRGYRFGVEVKKRGGSEANAAATEQERVTRPRDGGGKSRAKKLMIALGVVGLAIIVPGIYIIGVSRWSNSELPFQTMKIVKLTTSGKVAEAIISPDGKYVAFVLADGGKRSVRVKQVAAGTDVEIVSPGEDILGGLAFSRDGNFVYFLKMEQGTLLATLYRTPVLGGAERRQFAGLSSGVAFSPDGARLAFLRHRQVGESALIVANADGSGERTLVVRRRPESFARAPAWSPDGKLIVCQIEGATRFRRFVVTSVVDGTTQEVGPQKWNLGQITWLPDSSGLVVAAVEDSPNYTSSNSQIWGLSVPDGDVSKITNDLSNYVYVSLASDANMLVTVQQERLANLWLIPYGKASLAKQISFGVGKREGFWGLALLPDGRIVYDADTGGPRSIWIVNPDGNNPRPLIDSAPGRVNRDPSVSPDGDFIVYVSNIDRPHLWRVDSNGGNAQQLTFGDGEVTPQVSPDGKWVVYVALNTGKPMIWKLSLDGGAAIQLTDRPAMTPLISPDGEMIVYQYWDNGPNPLLKVALIPFSGGEPIKTFDLDPHSQRNIRWSPDGRALTYVEDRAGVSNLWSLPLDGSAPLRLTNFKSDHIYNYVWSCDGRQLVCVRGIDVSDAVLISGFR
jgi:Tol biopolymer transport system component/DNA-binding winged helix-turn-helix (wHTH) protein